MKTERKMLISIALVFIMLLNCMMPLLVVNAATDEEIVLNYKLYSAVKNALSKDGVNFTYNDYTRTINISSEVIATIEKMSLNDSGISDLTGLEKFTSLKHLELSGNNLTKDSNLEVLSALPLNHLDLSTNKLEDVSAIDTLINTIQSNNGTVILSGQTVTIATEAIIDINEESDNIQEVSVELPSILEKAGFIKSVWKKDSSIAEMPEEPEDGEVLGTPYVSSFPSTVTSTNNTMKVRIADGATILPGLVKLEIYIYDDATEASSATNINKAANNILNGSRFYIYVVVHTSDTTAITTPDTNLYNAIKEQLTAGQLINTGLDSYPYIVDINGDIVYDECTYITVGSDQRLTVKGEDTPKYILSEDGIVYLIEDPNSVPWEKYPYTNNYEKTVIEYIDKDGNITYKSGYKVAQYGQNIDLYDEVYDEAKTFIIDNNVLINKITSLILNNKQIRDLSGLEKFVGLNSDLNVSHNYLSNIDSIYQLEPNKEAAEVELQSKYSYWLNSRSYGNLQKAVTEMDKVKDEADKLIEDIELAKNKIKSVQNEITALNNEMDDLDSTAQDYNDQKKSLDDVIKSKEEEITSVLNNVIGYYQDDGTYVKGYIQLLEETLGESSTKVNNVYSYIDNLYNIYNKQYKLATLLTPDLNYLDYEEYLAYEDKLNNGTAESVKALVQAEISKLIQLEANNGLSDFEKSLIMDAFSISIKYDENGMPSKTPIADYFNEFMSGESGAGSRLQWVEMIEIFREIALYAEIANYCIIEKISPYSSNLTTNCYSKEYLENKIKDFTLEGIDTTTEKELIELIENLNDFDNTTDKLAFANSIHGLTGLLLKYMSTEHQYTNNTSYNLCIGSHPVVYKLDVNPIVSNISTVNELLNTEIKISEYITDDIHSTDGLHFYDAHMSIAKKIVLASAEISRYVTLPKLKKLDISYNSYLEGIEELSTLTGMRELQANANYIANIENVDWTAIKYLRKLGLNYNYITDISVLENLEYLEDLDVSHNLLSGTLKFNLENIVDTLKNLDLSHNQIEDITPLLQFLDGVTNGNYGTYLAREDTINIDLGYQTLNLEVSEPVYLTEYPQTINVDLPKIFTQLKAIDAERTAFGITSQTGRIESEGTYVTLNTKTVGDKTGVVEVVAMSGNNKPVDTCIGIGTTATIKYTVADRTVSEVKVLPETSQVAPGETYQYTAEVTGANLLDTSVTWTVSGNTSASTIIDSNGLLTVAADEASTSLTVTATSNFDNTKSGSTVATLVTREITTFELTPTETTILRGQSADFTLIIDGNNLRDEDKEVEWNVSAEAIVNEAGEQVLPALSENTTYTINNNVLTLVVGEDEEADKLTVTATSKDNTKVATATVTLAEREVTNVVITPAEVSLEVGKTQQFTASVEGNEYLEDKAVVWSVSGNTSLLTTIDENGLLTIGDNEISSQIKVRATSNFDDTKYAEATVNVIVKREVTGVTITPNTAEVEAGKTQQFTSQVLGTNLENKSVTWTVSGNTSEETTIDENGLLTIAENEGSETIKVKATSNFDNTKHIEATVSVKLKREVTGVVITPNTAEVEAGKTQEFTSEVVGLNVNDQSVTWSISGNTSSETKISENGLLTVAENETSETIKVKATSNFDNTKFVEITVNVKVKREVTGITITPNVAEVEAGKTQEFTSEVVGLNLQDKLVNWSISGNTSSETKISENGVLTIANDETAKQIKVRATSNFDNTKYVEVTVSVKNTEPTNSIEFGYKVVESIIRDVEAKLPVDVFKSNLTEDYKVVVKTADEENKQEVTDGIMKTGMWVYIYAKDDEEMTTPLKDEQGNLLVYQVAVKGDVNGDGVANSLDTKLIKAARNEVGSFSEAQMEAADINGDNKINVTDSKLLLYHRAEVIGYNLNYVAE